MPSSDIANAVEDRIDSPAVSPAANGAPPPPSEEAREDDHKNKNNNKNNNSGKDKEEDVRVLFRDEEEFRRKRERMVADGAHQLQVIAGPFQIVLQSNDMTCAHARK